MSGGQAVTGRTRGKGDHPSWQGASCRAVGGRDRKTGNAPRSPLKGLALTALGSQTPKQADDSPPKKEAAGLEKKKGVSAGTALS